MTTGTLLAQGEKDLVTVPQSDSPALLFERFASDPNVSVEKIERLMALWERGEARKAEAAFNAAMTAAQKAMRPVQADAWNPQTKSKYASYEALDRALRPIYTEHGFGLSFNTTDSPMPEHVRVLCKVTHQGGHAEHYQVDMPADGKGAKGGDVMTKTHATGSAFSYGQRYLVKLIWNVAVGEDDDGNKASGKPEKPTPDGYDKWLDDMQSVADEGEAAFEMAWSASKPEFRKFLIDSAPKLLAGMRTKARRVGK